MFSDEILYLKNIILRFEFNFDYSDYFFISKNNQDFTLSISIIVISEIVKIIQLSM